MKTELTTYNISTRAYIFDYGGTLDTGGDHWGRVIWQAYEAEGVPVGEAGFRDAYVAVERRLGRETLVSPQFTFRQTLALKLRLQLELLGCDLRYADIMLERLYAQTVSQTRRSREVLGRLAGQVPLALVSNFYGNLSTVLREMELDGLFCDVVESAVVGVRKPDARIFRLALDRLALSPQDVTIVGDSLKNDIRPARQLGCPAVWLRGRQWEEPAPSPSEPAEPAGVAAAPAQPCRIINDLSELL